MNGQSPEKTPRRYLRLSLRWKTLVVCIFLLAAPGLLIGMIGYNTAKSELDQLGQSNLKHNVEMTIRLIDAYQGMVDKGMITKDEAQEQVRTRVVGPKKADGKTRDITNKIGDSGYIFALDSKGLYVMHPTQELENTWDLTDPNGVKYVQNIIKAGTQTGGISHYENQMPGTEQIEQKVTYSQLDPHWNWTIAAGSYVHDFNKGSNDIRHTMVITLAAFIIIGSIIAFWYAGHLSRPLHKITLQVEQVAAGNLVLDELKVRNRDEVGTLAAHFGLMKEQMRTLIGGMSETAQHVAGTGEQLLATSEEAGRVTEQIATSVQEVAGGAQLQAEIIGEINSLVSVAMEATRQIVRGSEQASTTSHDAARAAENGKHAIDESIAHMKVIEEKVKGIERAVASLEQKSTAIGEMIAAISQIAVQTNILALNAGIEASRAGEMGRGFAVVATEVKKLALQTRTASDQVTELIRQVQHEVSEAAAATREEAEAVAAGLSLAVVSEDAFAQVFQAVQLSADHCKEVASASYDVTIRMDGLVSAVEQIAAISEETAGQSDGVASATEEQSVSMREVSMAAQELSKVADEMQQLVSVFRVTDK